MTATPDKRTDSDDNIYEIFNHQIAYEIRLQQAMEEELLCPFHYFGITDLSVVQDTKSKNLSHEEFNKLICDERVEHILEQANYYGYSGERVEGKSMHSGLKPVMYMFRMMFSIVAVWIGIKLFKIDEEVSDEE